MGRRPAYGLVGLPFALAVLALAPAVRAQPVPPVVPSVEPPSVETPPVPAPPLETPPAEAPPADVPLPAAPPPAAPPQLGEPLPLAEAPPPAEPPEIVEAEVLALAPPLRPRLSLAVGVGATRDSTGFPDGGGHFIPAFFGVGGFGDGLGGFDLGAFSSAASGRFPTADSPVDRLALDAFGVLRPAARVRPGDQRYPLRVLRTIGAELGLGFERDGQVVVSGTRWVVHTGARIEFPLTSGQASELRLRLAMRRAFGLYTPELSKSASSATISVGDSTELYAALAVVF